MEAQREHTALSANHIPAPISMDTASVPVSYAHAAD